MTFNEYLSLRRIFVREYIGYSYFKDQYALQLLQYQIEKKQLRDGIKISDIKNGKLGFLTEKKPFKKLSAGSGNNRITHSDLKYFESDERLDFNISFRTWGDFKPHRKVEWRQTTRPGFSWVLQLNFDQMHDVSYHKLIKQIEGHPFRYLSHPVCPNNRLTMAWARLDFDLDTGELLIEEIQNDWIREAHNLYKNLVKSQKKYKKRFENHWFFENTKADMPSFKKYLDEVLIDYKNIWDEAIMSAAIWFSVKELGISDIYIHTHEGGKLLKNCNPPRSLYSKLPRRFGFKKTDVAPVFIQNCHYLKKTLRKNKIEWWRLSF